ncbi:HAD family hydrolase [Cohnella soli]|uniref:HAD family hydrolase n=1 Tax=Cohnella soli TaxID=425005 RepID=A0ABW0I4D2_9BACL
MIKAILFDMDGVLLDSRELHFMALNRALHEICGMEISLSEHLSTYDGIPTIVKLKMLEIEKGLPADLHGIIIEKKQHYTVELLTRCCHPNHSHIMMLERLRNEGFELGLCSNSVKQTVELAMRHLGMRACFNFLLSNEDVDNPKPHPEIYQKAFKLLGRQPTECLIVEDSDKGREAAEKSGAHLLMVKGIEQTDYDRISLTIKGIEDNLIFMR